MTGPEREYLIQLEECLISAQNAARALATEARLVPVRQSDYDLWGTIKVNLEVLQKRCAEAILAIR